jgi:hypothetical protein
MTPEGSSQHPDLIAVPDGSFGGPDAFCDLTSGTIDIPTPSVRAGQRTMLAPVLIPAACFDPDCILEFWWTHEAK